MTYSFKSPNLAPISFIKFKGPNHDDDLTLEDLEKEKIQLKSDLNHINQGFWKYKSPEQAQTISNIENLYNSREDVVKRFNDYAKNMSKNIYESKQGKGLKVLTPKQMLQRLPIALAKIKAGNNSENLLNEIRQIVE